MSWSARRYEREDMKQTGGGNTEQRRELDKQKDFTALAVNRMRREAQRTHTCQQPVITRQSSAHRPVQGLTRQRNGGRNSIKIQINKQVVFPLATGTGRGAGSSLCVLVSHQEGEGGRDMVGVVETEHIF